MLMTVPPLRNSRGGASLNEQPSIKLVLTGIIMTVDPDPYEEGQRAARENIPAGGNPYQDGSQEHSLWATGHEEVAGAAEASESEGS
jgi:hypothetical protein